MGSLVECHCYLGGTRRVPRERLSFRPSVYGLITHGQQVLLVATAHSGKYFLPGGALELGETLAEALQREVREEVGVEIAVGALAGFKEHFFYYDPLDEAYQSLLFFYRCQPKTFALLANDQIDDAVAVDPAWRDWPGLRAEDFQDHGELIVRLLSAGGMAV
jgi:8-oxo-dGTP pyrophosphatase MutT (NUDIX family)